MEELFGVETPHNMYQKCCGRVSSIPDVLKTRTQEREDFMGLL